MKNHDMNKEAASQNKKQRKEYVAPRVVSHSSEKVEKASLTVNACTSFIP